MINNEGMKSYLRLALEYQSLILSLTILSEILFKILKTCSCSETRRSKVEEAEGRGAEVERKEKKGSVTPRTERRCQLPRAEKAAANRALAELRTPRKSRSRSGDHPRNLARAGGGRVGGGALAPSLASSLTELRTTRSRSRSGDNPGGGRVEGGLVPMIDCSAFDRVVPMPTLSVQTGDTAR